MLQYSLNDIRHRFVEGGILQRSMPSTEDRPQNAWPQVHQVCNKFSSRSPTKAVHPTSVVFATWNAHMLGLGGHYKRYTSYQTKANSESLTVILKHLI